MNKVLVIEDDENIRLNVLDLLDAEGFEGLAAYNGETGVKLAVQHLPDLIICDVGMPGIDGYEVLEILSMKPATAVIPFVFLSARAEHADIRRGMTLGADDYLTKPFTRAELLDTIRTRLLRSRHRASNEPTSDTSPAQPLAAGHRSAPAPRTAQRIVLEDPTMRALFAQLERIAAGPISVLILGETGVGKEVVAEQIHRLSRRRGPLVALNCGALPESLLESELFDHEKGAFTGAIASKPGFFESAHAPARVESRNRQRTRHPPS
jgi:DNA-binding NtrC family response regulator